MTVRAATEGDVLAGRAGSYTLAELYAAVQAAGDDLVRRHDGLRVVHGASDTRWKRRVRGALQTMKRQGRARRVSDGVWVLDGPVQAPRRAVLLSLAGTHAAVELRLQTAAGLLEALDEPVDLICCDPPYGLGVGTGPRHDVGARTYQRDGSRVVAGYEDVPAAQYRAFTREWIDAAAHAVRPGGYLCVITGPQQAAWVQVCAEDTGQLTYVNSLAVGRVFPLRTTRRFAHAHWTVTLMCRGPLNSRARFFTPPPDLPKARSGRDYPLDLWPVGAVGRADARRGEVRYANSLPLLLVDRLVGALTRPPTAQQRDVVCDPFVGGGTTAVVAAQRGLRFIGGDVNTGALAFTAARVSRALLAAPADDTA